MEARCAPGVGHGPLFTRPPKSGEGWIVPSCDCGWEGRPVHGALLAAQAYGEHIAQAASTPSALGATWTLDDWERALIAGQRAGRIRQRPFDRKAADGTVPDQETWFAFADSLDVGRPGDAAVIRDMERTEFYELLRAFLAEQRPDLDGEIEPSTHLWEAGYLDSFGVIEVLALIEEVLGHPVTVDADDLSMFFTMDGIYAAFVAATGTEVTR